MVKRALLLVLVNRKSNSGYHLFFPYNDDLVSPIPQRDLAGNSTTPIITPEKSNSVTSNLTKSPGILTQH